jgi:hypothetical protein
VERLFSSPIPNIKIPPAPSGTRTFSIAINNPEKQELTLAMQMPFPYSPTAPTEAQFDGTWASGITLLSAANPAGTVMAGPESPSTPLNALTSALRESTQLIVLNQPDADLPGDSIVLVISQKRPIVVPFKNKTTAQSK